MIFPSAFSVLLVIIAPTMVIAHPFKNDEHPSLDLPSVVDANTNSSWLSLFTLKNLLTKPQPPRVDL